MFPNKSVKLLRQDVRLTQNSIKSTDTVQNTATTRRLRWIKGLIAASCAAWLEGTQRSTVLCTIIAFICVCSIALSAVWINSCSPIYQRIGLTAHTGLDIGGSGGHTSDRQTVRLCTQQSVYGLLSVWQVLMYRLVPTYWHYRLPFSRLTSVIWYRRCVNCGLRFHGTHSGGPQYGTQ